MPEAQSLSDLSILKEVHYSLIRIFRENGDRDGLQPCGIVADQEPVALLEFEGLAEHVLGNPKGFGKTVPVAFSGELADKVRMGLGHDGSVQIDDPLCGDADSEAEFAAAACQSMCNVHRFLIAP